MSHDEIRTMPSPEVHEGPQHKHGSLRSYLACLRDNPAFCWLWFAECVNTMGSWFNYVATLDIILKFSNGSGLALAAVVLLHFLPSLLLAPLAGVTADRFNRVKILLCTSFVDCIFVACMVTVTEPSHTHRLYVLLLLQFSGMAFYAPARTALLPVVVKPVDLPAATTLDSFAWSLTGAIAASLGGIVASKLGTQTCFILDAVTYAVSAGCALGVPMALGVPGADPHGARPSVVRKKPTADDEVPAPAPSPKAKAGGGPGAGPPPPALHRPGLGGGPAAGAQHHRRDSGLWELARCQLGTAWSGVVEGCSYLAASENREVVGIVSLKAAGALSWGPLDIVNARFSNMPEMQALGDAAVTMGLIFGMVGLGCLLGPLLTNPWVQPRVPHLLGACAASLGLLTVGYAMMLVAPSIGLILFSTFVRATGSANLWVFSSLALQLRVPGALLGRLSAWEMALYTLCEASSSLSAGVALDYGHVSVHAVVLAVLGVSASVTAAYGAWVASRALRARDGWAAMGSAGVYTPVHDKGVEEGEEAMTHALELGPILRHHVHVEAD